MTRKFKQVDVFTQTKYKGNPVAVLFDGEGLSTEEMQTIANWTNLSETTFVLPPTVSEADYLLRIFTPTVELPFAGHPTIGSAHAVLESGFAKSNNGRLVQECAAGLVQLTINDNGHVKFLLPKYIHVTHTTDALREEIADAVGVQPSDVKLVVGVDDGPEWLTIEFTSGEAVFDMVADYPKVKKICDTTGNMGICCFGKYANGEYEQRNFFFENDAAVEDPVCGSGAGATASVLAELSGIEGDIAIRQGRKLQRDGHIKVTIEKSPNNGNDYSIFVGGHALTCFDGNW